MNMSLSDEWTEYHLTPQGWIRGTRKVDGAGIVEQVERPKEAVLTCRYREYVGSFQEFHYEGISSGVREIWNNGNVKTIGQLKRRFGNCPESLYGIKT